MDYEGLYSILPKSHSTWTVEETKKWLSFIGLNNLHDKFEACSIDGSILANLNEQDFEQQLHIESKIIIKKLINWVTNGIQKFDQFVKMQEMGSKRNKMNNSALYEDFFSKDKLMFTKVQNKKIEEKEAKRREGTFIENSKKPTEENELIIKQCQQSQVASFYLKEKGGMIGRHSSNQIVVIDEFVSRYHAEIVFQNQEYYIKDCGTSSGTFIKISEKKQLCDGMILQMGSNQFLIEIDRTGNLLITIIEGPNINNHYPLLSLDKISIGRKQSNEISFPDDQHLSGIHSKLFKVQGIWYVEDIATTNGTWLRLSREGEESALFLLDDQSQFKLSSNLIYECRRNRGNRKTFKKDREQKCIFCKTEQKNAIVMPCKHTVGCYDCLGKVGMKVCCICQSEVKDIIKIFTV